MKILKTLAITSLLFSQFALADDVKTDSKELTNKESITQEDLNIKSENVNEKKLTTSERINIIIDEKKRLRTVLERRKDDGEQTLNKNYIRNTDYSEYVKGLMREASFYMNYIYENNENEEMIKKEVKNLIWNSVCLASILDIDADVVFTVMKTTVIGKSQEEAFEKGNKIVNKLFREFKPASNEEINIRCYEVYKNKNEKKSNPKK